MARVMIGVMLALLASLVVNEAGRCERRGGVCQHDSDSCAGFYQSRLCPGASYIRCCITGGDDRCTRRGGVCQWDSRRCWLGGYVNGLCNGPSSRRCCV